jgi:hypothetical protein
LVGPPNGLPGGQQGLLDLVKLPDEQARSHGDCP